MGTFVEGIRMVLYNQSASTACVLHVLELELRPKAK
jgi:hypothetical protein